MDSISGLRRIVLGYIMICCLRSQVSETSSVTEHCMVEVFEADCPDGHIIVMQSALFGRMRLGRCIQGGSGGVGCVADVITYFDKQCSGKQVCSVDVASRPLFALNVCPEYTPYLEVAYNCIPVIGGSVYLTCRSEGSITLSGHSHPEGFVSSTNVYNNRWGSRICPWVIEAEPGQKINISIVDFGLFQGVGPDIDEGRTCQKYVMLADVGSTQPTKTVCSSHARERNVYISQSHSLEIRFEDKQEGEVPPNFLLKYSVLGCSDPETNGNTLDERTLDKAVLYCANSGKRYHLNCIGKSWNSQAGYCKETVWSFGDIFPEDWSSRQAILIVLGIGIGLGIVVGLAIVVCALLCLKRMYRSRREQSVNYPADCCPVQDQYGIAKPKEYIEDSADTGYHTYVRRKTSTMSYVQACDSETVLVGTARKPMMSPTDYVYRPASAEHKNSDSTYKQACGSETYRTPVMSSTNCARHPTPAESTGIAIAYADADDDQVYNKPL